MTLHLLVCARFYCQGLVFTNEIIFVYPKHVERVVLLTRKSTTTYSKEIDININNELI